MAGLVDCPRGENRLGETLNQPQRVEIRAEQVLTHVHDDIVPQYHLHLPALHHAQSTDTPLNRRLLHRLLLAFELRRGRLDLRFDIGFDIAVNARLGRGVDRSRVKLREQVWELECEDLRLWVGLVVSFSPPP